MLLAIESSCDETAAAVCDLEGKIRSNVLRSQAIHAKYGGVIPELASRAHQQSIVTVVQHALQQAGITKNEVKAIAVTQGPGLMGALLVGVHFAKGFALSKNIPLIAVNHIQAHVLAHLIEHPNIEYPFLCLLVSGGHTQIMWVKSPLEMKVVGQTLDDAAGEAFDKGAKMLGFTYPGGPLIDKYAQKGNSDFYPFPIANVPDFNYSFSGLKTALLYYLQKQNTDFVQLHLADICASYQKAITQALLDKFALAIQKYGPKVITLSGGVAANSYIRTKFLELGKKFNLEAYIPKFEYCTDNAAMIAIAGLHLWKAGKIADQSLVPFVMYPNDS
ncbi:MAG: tRNA (adenosine(37)-N6)-threonylcarbamoyltransferase complex transferase subunit TsaD [Bacteroidia bacterium]|nr:tRNA (adenosine(37)-N6)-threonylcarbamoyltransferase complex transferase subunit TsaD [Bacteroidia bacterium]MDW8346748.1 tRNA (adenosine(37)-N6)-threonylcarbamoyltransferase complex transferase subunit TsaD [Bacteroidia bacterium]